MFLTSCTVFLAALSGLSTAAPTTSRHVVHEERGSLLRDWAKTGRVEGSAILPMRIGLMQSNLHRGDELLDEVTNPSSPKYGQWYTPEEIHALFSPSAETVAAVRAWIIASGIEDSREVHSENKGWLAFDAAAEEAKRLLKANFFEFTHTTTNRLRVGVERYHIPEELSGHIDFVTPGVKLTPVVKRSVKRAQTIETRDKTSRSIGGGITDIGVVEQSSDYPTGPWKPPYGLDPSLSDCWGNMTIPCLRALYSIPESKSAVPGNTMGLYEQGDYFDKPDLDLYWKTYAPNVPVGTYPIPALIDGATYDLPQNDSSVQGEAIIDIVLSQGLIYPQTVTVYQVDDMNYAEKDLATTNLFNTFLDALDGSYCTYSAFGETGNDPNIDPVYPDPTEGGYKGQLQCGVYKPAKVISASYGQAEADLPANYQKRQCNEFLKLGLQGTSMVVSSGDDGVSAPPGDAGSANGCLGPQHTIFAPQYPSNCPYVTSVGATMVLANNTVLDPEYVLNQNATGRPSFSSSAGFSNIYPMPSYQKAALDKYFKEHNPPYESYAEFGPDLNTIKGVYNRIGRGYPDVAANGARAPVFIHGVLKHSSGTSLSAPIFGAVLTLLNEERARIGKGSIGFVNPVLYAHPEVLIDITHGNNKGCGTSGFNAVPGWDPATGLGTPNYEKMRELFLSLP